MEQDTITQDDDACEDIGNTTNKHSAYFEGMLEYFANRVMSHGCLFPVHVVSIQNHVKSSEESYKKFKQDHCRRIEDEKKQKLIAVPVDKHTEYEKLRRQVFHAELCEIVMVQNAIVSLVSIYDEYMGQLLRALYLCSPDKIKNSKKTFSLPELLKFKSINEAKEKTIEDEVDKFLRKSRVKQFEAMEELLGIPLTQGLDCWGSFIEVTERRHLFVHCGGVVNQSYLDNCQHLKGLEIPLPEIGQVLSVPQEYFTKAWKTHLEIGYKLGHTIWRKLLNTHSQADEALNDYIVELIKMEHYDVAENFCRFGLFSIPREASHYLKTTLTFNLAQIMKWQGKQDECIRIIEGADIDGLNEKFPLAVHVLKDEFAEAAAVMKMLPADSKMEVAYNTWPIFKQFRETDEFLESYEELYGKSWKSEESINS